MFKPFTIGVTVNKCTSFNYQRLYAITQTQTLLRSIEALQPTYYLRWHLLKPNQSNLLMSEQLGFPDVQEKAFSVPFDVNEAYKYMVEVLGKREKIPTRFTIKDGSTEILMCLRVRYGASHVGEYASLLAWQLRISKGDGDVWDLWRRECSEIEVNVNQPICSNSSLKVLQRDGALGWGSRKAVEEKILKWDEGISGDILPVRVNVGGSAPVFTSSDEFERRVDNANGSRVASGLAAESKGGGGLMRHLLAESEVTPWEPRGVKASIGKVKEAAKKVFEHGKSKQS